MGVKFRRKKQRHTIPRMEVSLQKQAIRSVWNNSVSREVYKA